MKYVEENVIKEFRCVSGESMPVRFYIDQFMKTHVCSVKCGKCDKEVFFRSNEELFGKFKCDGLISCLPILLPNS